MPFPEYPPTVPEMIQALSRTYGASEMIVLDDTRLTYEEAERDSAILARGLLAQGVGKGTRVGLLMPNGPDWVRAWLAVTRIGAVLVPLNTFFQTRELQWILRHADVHTLLCVPQMLSHDYLTRLEEAAPTLGDCGPSPFYLPDLPHLRQVFVFGESRRPWAQSADLLRATPRHPMPSDFLQACEAEVRPADLMAVLYSSGSTADPKGALHTQGTIIRHAYNLASGRDITSADRVWSPMPFFWVGGFVFSLIGNMFAGATTLCETVFDPPSTLAFLEREKVTVALGWPHFGKALAEHADFPSRDLSSLRAGNVPDILPVEIVPEDPTLRPTALGMTETCGPHTWTRLDNILPPELRGSFGTAVEGVEHRISEPETGTPLPQGELGEIQIRGYSLMQGLHKTEREDTFEADGFYRTGDAGYFDAEGVLYFKGRLGEMIKTAGANVTPSEVEQVLIGFPEVKEAYVVGVQDPERGQNVEAAVVLEPGLFSDGESLRDRLKGEISAYKVPRHVFIFPSGELPFTDTGKIDKRKLTQVIASKIQAA